MLKLPDVQAVIGLKVLIAGDVNTGKTFATAKMAQGLLVAGLLDMVILDFAPETTRGIGGKMPREGLESVEYITTQIIPPRMTAKTPEEVLAFALSNARKIEAVLQMGLGRPRQVAVINDVSLYLQAAEVDSLLRWLRNAGTALINGYYGKSFDESEFSRLECSRMESLMKSCDQVILL